jgi:peptidylprolyl isomerase/FKBP-type peptidyl-prolyl cis-trans isomerase FklB
MVCSKLRPLALAGFMILSACGQKKPPPPQLAAGQAFLAQNAKADGVKVLPDGLQYRVLSSGPADGAHPRAQDEVKVNYEGKLLGPANAPLSGQAFDSSFERGMPADFGVGEVVPGWTEALQLMRPGDEWMIYLPPTLGYGDHGMGPIPPGSVLVFRVQLLGVLQHSG